jgi:YegS/Rv2252/BmrU family lipid kinase
MPQAVVIINPVSGRGRHPPNIEVRSSLAREVLAGHGFDVLIRPTAKSGDARAFAREAVDARCDLVVAWGGDGTVNEAASALVRTQVPLAIVPAGSGNGLAADLGVPIDPRAALGVAATAATLTIDAGTVDDHLFFNIAGVGVDAVIAAQFAERPRHRRGFVGYLQLSSAELMRYRCQTYTLTMDDGAIERRAMLMAFANGRQYGNRMLIAPGARLDDGLLEVVVVEELSVFGIAWRLPALFRGTLQPGRGITMRAARQVRVSSSAAIPYHVDGEPRLGSDVLMVAVQPRALRVRAPKQHSLRS